MNRHAKDGRLTPEQRDWVEWVVRRYVKRKYPNDEVVHRHLVNSIVRSVELSLGRDGEVVYRWEGGRGTRGLMLAQKVMTRSWKKRK